jgi:hypothetical protein
LMLALSDTTDFRLKVTQVTSAEVLANSAMYLAGYLLYVVSALRRRRVQRGRVGTAVRRTR